MTRVGLVACSSTKLDRPAPARDLYQSPLFRKSVAWIEPRVDRWYVLSALHGLVDPDRVIKPYDVRLGTPDAGPIWAWANHTRYQIEDALRGVDDVQLVVLAGEQYRTCLQRSPWPVEVPMQGLGIGEQLAFLTPAA